MKQLFSKKIGLAWALMLVSLAIGALEPSIIKLESIVEIQDDMKAKYLLEHSENNKNRDRALIKISTNLDCSGFNLFDFGSIGKGVIECKDNMTYVFAPAGASKLQRVGHEKAGQEQVSQNFPDQLQFEKGKIYVMVLKGLWQSPAPNPEESLKQQFLVAQCSVPGAIINIQGQGSEAFENGVFRKLMPFGQYTYVVDAPRYQPDRGVFEISAADKTTLQITLKPNFATVTLSGNGDIYINEQLKGTNRWSGELTKGTYKAEVRKLSHRPSLKTFDVEADKNLNLVLDPPTPIYGKLQIDGNAIAQIYIDGKSTGETTPAILQQVLIGAHRVELRASGYENSSQNVTVDEGKIAQLMFTLEKTEKPVVKASDKKPAVVPAIPGESNVKTKLFLEYAWTKTAPLGVFAGACKNWGGYLQFKTDLNSIDYIDRLSSDETMIANTPKYKRMAITGGVLCRLADWCYLYSGVGYGEYAALYKYVDSSEDRYYAGIEQKSLEAEAGVKLVLGPVSVSAGYCTIPSEPYFGDFSVGVGFVLKLK